MSDSGKTPAGNTHGGRRPGAGRKPGDGQAEATTVMRVPASQAGTIRDFVAALQRKRRHEAQDNVVDLSQLAPDDRRQAFPLYTTRVAAGFPSPADDHVDKRLSPTDYLVQNDSATFFVRVKGDSMVDAGIFENDVLVVDRSIEARVGDIVLAILDGEFTVKTLGKSKSGPRLMPANRNYPVIEVREGQTLEVCGVVTGSMRKFK